MKRMETIFYKNKKNRHIAIKQLRRSYVELESKLKVMEEKCKTNDSKKHQTVCR